METKMKKIAEIVIDKTLQRCECEKETKLSKKTLKMVSLSNKLFISLACWIR